MKFATNLLMEMAGAACTIFRHSRRLRLFPYPYACTFLILFGAPQPTRGANQQKPPKKTKKPRNPRDRPGAHPTHEPTEDGTRRIRELMASADSTGKMSPREYTIGPDDVLDINVFEAQELNRQVRVSANGEISLPLLGAVRAAGLTPRELEKNLEELLPQKYMKDPHIGVFVREMQSHAVSVVGAVRKPGTFQISSSKSLLEILSLAEWLAEDAGEEVTILRGAALNNPLVPLSEKANDVPASPPATQSQLLETQQA